MDSDPIPPPRDLAQRVRRALDRISVRDEPRDIGHLADKLFQEIYGSPPTDTVGVSTYVPLIAEHTRYFGGFGVLMRVPGGVGAAVRSTLRGFEVAVTGPNQEVVQSFLAALSRLLGQQDADIGGVQIAVVSESRVVGEESVLAAAGVAFLRAIRYSGDAEKISALITAAMETVLLRPCGPAQVLATLDGGPIVLIDAGSYEHIALERPEALGAAIIDVGVERSPDPSVFRERAALLETSLQQLRQRGYATLTSLRRLEHHELPRALSAVDSGARPFLRHLVTEDRRVPRLVAAVRREDPQVVGALLLMSHASRRDEVRASIEEVEYVIGLAEAADGVYGARVAGLGYGGRVVLVGRPFVLPDIVDDLVQQFIRHFDIDATATLL
jgi:galactokinase